MNKIFKILNIILISLILIGDILYICAEQNLLKINDLATKSITSILFVTLGIINCIFSFKKDNKIFFILMLTGLFFAMLGDILLEIEFIVGALLFAIGHVFYYSAYTSLQKFNPRDILIGITIFIPSLIILLLVPLFDFGSSLMQIVCIIYALIISLMVGKSISNLTFKKSTLNILLVIGSCLFFFSDFMLLFNVFASISRLFGILCLATYYPAEIILAYSLSKND